jgi:hypothetical protein
MISRSPKRQFAEHNEGREKINCYGSKIWGIKIQIGWEDKEC